MSDGRRLIMKLLALAAAVMVAGAAARDALPTGWGNRRLRATVAHWRSAGRETHVLFLGSSRVYRQIDPAVFDDAVGVEGLRSRNLGAPACFNPERYALLEELLGSSPAAVEAIICELDVLVRYLGEEHFDTPRSLYWRSTRWSLHAVFSEAPSHPHVSRASSVVEARLLVETWFFYGMGERALQVLHGPPRAEWSGPAANGYYALEDEVATGDAEGAARRRERDAADPEGFDELVRHCTRAYVRRGATEPDAVHVELLAELCARARERGIQLVFFVPPRIRPMDQVLALHDALPQRHRIELGDPREYPHFYDFARSFDHGHLDSAASAALSRELGHAYARLRRIDRDR